MAAISAREPSLEDLRRLAEQTRAGLTGTVEELRARVADTAADLRERVSPAAIKAEVKDFVRESGEQLVHTIQRKARENPLQAVAIGAGLAYPLWNILRSLPAPIMLIGAGLLLARPMRSPAVRQAMADTMGNVGDGVRNVTETVQRSAEQATDGATRMVHDARDRINEVVDPLVAKASDAVTSVKESVSSTVADASAAMRDAGTSVYNTASGAVNSATEQVTQLGQKAKDGVAGAFEQNPLLVAGIGLAIGAIIASALPSSDAEGRLFGGAKNDLKEGAERLAARGVETAKGLAKDAAEAASDQGLSIDGLASAAGGLTDKLRSVADRGIETALGGETEPTNGKKQLPSERGIP